MNRARRRCVQLLTWIFVFFLPSMLYGQLKDTRPLSASFGEEMFLFQEIPSVYGASKYEQKVTEAPSSVSIVTAAEIRKYGYRTLADMLRSLPGFYTTYDRLYHYVGVRGFGPPGDYNTRVLLLVDGHRINDNIYDQAFIGTDFVLDVDLIDRVEVIRGPSSSLYGASAFFGVINVIAKRGRDLRGPEISGEAASYHTYKGRFTYGNRIKGLELLLSASTYDSKGQDLYFREFDDPETNNGKAEDCDGDEYYNLFLESSFRDFTLQGAYVSRDKGFPTAAWGSEFNDSRNRMTDERGYLDLNYEHSFANQLDVNARIYYDRYEYGGDFVWDYADPGDPPYIVVNEDYAVGKWWGGELRVTENLIEKHRATLGWEYRRNFQQDQGNYDEDVYLDDERDSKIWALYIQDEFQVLDNVTFNAGVRYDHYSTFGGTTNPRLALIHNPFEKTTLKLLYGEAFRAPNAYELYYHDGGESQKTNPDLKPETIKTYELVLEQYIGVHLMGTLSGFYYKIEDLIIQETDPADDLLVFNNIDDIKAKGIELKLEGKWHSGLEGRVSYTFEDAENDQTGRDLTNSPKHMAKCNLIAPLIKDKIFAGAELQYMTKRKTLGAEDADDFFVCNLTVFSQSLIKGLELSASVYNLFDKEYDDSASGEHSQNVIEQDGRSFRVKFAYAF